MKNSSSMRTHFFMMTIALLALPACSPLDWFKSGDSKVPESASNEPLTTAPTASLAEAPTGDVLVTINGQPAITTQTFEKEFSTLVENNPQVKALLPLMPDLEDKFFEGLLNQQIVDRYISANKIDATKEYQQQLNEFIKQAKQVINEIFFTQQFPAVATDTEVKKFYEENKASIPELVVSYGGVNTMGVEFDSQDEAKAFLEKVKDKAAQFEKIAKESGLAAKFRDFKLINAQSVGLDPAIRNKVVTLKTFPTVEVVKGNDKKEWVCAALNQEKPKYHDFDKIKDQLMPVVQQEKQNKVKMEKLNELKKEYNIQVNKSYFDKKKEQQKTERMEKLQDALQQANTQSEVKPAPAKKARAA